MHMRLIGSLRQRKFLSLWSGQTISRIGDHLYQVALAWWVLKVTGSAMQMGAVMIFTFAPMLLFLLVGGVTVDRFSRAKVMFWSDIGRGVVVAGIAALAYADRLAIWHLYLGGVVFGFADAFFQPAYAAAVPEIVPRDDLTSANSITSLSVQTGRVAGPALAAGIIALGGIPLAFALNAASFFISAACLLPLLGNATQPSAPPREPAETGGNIWRDLREGFTLVISLPWLWMTIAILAITNVTLSGPYSVSLPFLVKDQLHRDVGTLGTIYAIFPIGYLVAAVWLGSVNSIARRGWIIYLGMGAAGAMMLVIGLPVGVVGICVAAFINGAALEAASLAWTNAMQEKIPPQMLGRVSSIDSLGSYALLPIGYAAAGFLTDHLGAPMVFMLGGGLTAAAIRRFD